MKNKNKEKILNKIKKIFNSNVFKYYLIVFFIPLILTIILEFYLSLSIFGQLVTVPFKNTFIEYLFILSLFLIFTGTTNNLKCSTVLMSIILIIFSFFEQIKIYYMNEPINISDFFILETSKEIVDLVSKTILISILSVIKKLIVIIIIYSLLTSGLSSIKNFKTQKKHRLIMISISFLLMIILAFPPNVIKQRLYNNIFEVNDIKDYDTVISPLMISKKYGFIGSIYYNYLELKDLKPDKYDSNITKDILNNIEVSDDNSFGKPNIIVVFAESFWDISQIDEITFNKPLLPNITKLKEQGLYFDMISPSYGGASANVEFEFLTGANIQYYPNGFIPYLQLYNKSTYNIKESLIKELKNNGYKTSINYYTSKDLYKCQRFYDYLGIDESRSISDFENIKYKGNQVSDEYVIDQIIESFSKKEPNQKLFYIL